MTKTIINYNKKTKMFKPLLIAVFFTITLNCLSQNSSEDSLKVLSDEKIVYLKDGSLLNNITHLKDSTIINEIKFDDYPEPFSPPQPFKFAVYKRSKVSMMVYDSQERLVKTLVWNELSPGRYNFFHWYFFSSLPKGIYRCDIEIIQKKKEGFLIK